MSDNNSERKDVYIKMGKPLNFDFCLNVPKVKTEITYFTIYKTTNILKQDGDQFQFYVGKHIQYNNLDFDGYFGSGTCICEQVKEHGKENFKREYLELCSSEKEMELKEVYWIASTSANYYKYPDCGGMNRTNGGEYTFGFGLTGKNAPFYNKKCSDEHKRKISKSNKGRKLKQESIERLKKSKKGKYIGENNPMYGQHHTEESRKKMSEIQKKIYNRDKKCKYIYTLSTGENYWEVFNEYERNIMKNNFNRLKTNTIIYKGITITRTLKESENDGTKI